MRTGNPFLEQVRRDFENVLLNVEEFGRICSWNGAPLRIVDSAALEQEKPQGHGAIGELKLIVCRDIDLERPPVPFEEVMLDGEPWRVVDVRAPFAHYKITLERITA